MFYFTRITARKFFLMALTNAFHCKYNLLHFGLTVNQVSQEKSYGTFLFFHGLMNGVSGHHWNTEIYFPYCFPWSGAH